MNEPIELSGEEQAKLNGYVKRWNWGAFFLSWIWGIGNDTWIALLALLPIGNMVMPFVLGFKGNRMAWQNKAWISVDDFIKTQKRWNIWGVGFVTGTFALAGLLTYLTLITINKANTTAEYNKIVRIATGNEQVIKAFGQPITGSDQAKVKVDGNVRTIKIAIQSDQASGQIEALFLKQFNTWLLTKITVNIEGRFDSIIIDDPAILDKLIPVVPKKQY